MSESQSQPAQAMTLNTRERLNYFIMGGVLGAPTAMSTSGEYHVAVPLYLWPGYGSQPCAWERLLSSPDRNPLVVVNPDSGPGAEPVDLFKEAVLRCQAAGIKVIGYVRTIYAERPLADVVKDMQLYQTWYGVDGWFADEMFHWDASQVEYYAQIRSAAVKLLAAKPIVVLNPGCASWPEAYMRTADIFVTYESSADKYHEFCTAEFMTKYPKTMFWHMIYAARADTMWPALQRFRQQHAGWLYLTDLDLDNPYKDLPKQEIWQLQINAAREDHVLL